MQEIIKFKYRNPIIMNIQDLPEEILLSLIEYLHIKELIELELVSRFFNNFILEQKLYKKLYLKLSEYNHREYFDFWLETSVLFHIRKMESRFYKKRLYQHQFINGSDKVRGEETSIGNRNGTQPNFIQSTP